jgi:hypothetical protein
MPGPAVGATIGEGTSTREIEMDMPRVTPRRVHSGRWEILALAALYGLYELVRGIGSVDFASATEHAQQIVRLERSLGVFSERAVQQFCDGIPPLAHALAILYPTLHVVGTIGVLFWVYRSRGSAYPFVRTTLVVMTALALVVYVLYPVAPPRLAITGFLDTVSEHGPLDLSSKLLRGLYNPVAAVPSLHFGYALLVGGAVARLARARAIRIAGAFYPLVMLFVIVATGNHYFFDAVAGAAVALAAALAARALVPAQSSAGSSSSRASIGTRSTGIGLPARTSRTTAARP